MKILKKKKIEIGIFFFQIGKKVTEIDFFFKLGKKSPKSHWERGRISTPEDNKKKSLSAYIKVRTIFAIFAYFINRHLNTYVYQIRMCIFILGKNFRDISGSEYHWGRIALSTKTGEKF